MAKTAKKKPISTKPKEKPLAINGDFLQVFQVVKKDKERKAKEDKKKP